MPQQLGWVSSREIGFHPLGDPPLSNHEIRIQTRVTRFRRGIDSFPPGITVPGDFRAIRGAWGVGEVLEIGPAVEHYAPGDRIFGPMGHADRQVLGSGNVFPLSRFTNRGEFSTFIDAGMVALRGIHAAAIRYGDRVGVWGMGTVGLMAIQYALLSGAREVVAIDPLSRRRKIAQKLGAQITGASFADIRGSLDAAIDCSGTYLALMEAVDWVRPGGYLVAAGRADLANPASLRQACQERNVFFIQTDPHSYDPGLQERVEFSLVNKRVVVWPIISHYVPFSDATRICPAIQKQPNDYVQVLLTYDPNGQSLSG